MEELYHYIWKTKLIGSHIQDVDGNYIDIIDPGIHNNDSGPDFFNSKVKINGIEWIGNVEIHVRASDWFRHKHETDPAYNNVILHVVAVSDKRINRKDGSLLPQLQLTFPESFFRTVATLSEETDRVRCAEWIGNIPELNKKDWLESLALERLQEKASRALTLLKAMNGDWEQTCFVLLARGLGFGLNGEPFEMLAKSIPLKILHRHSDNLLQLEAILFGQASMLDPTCHIFDEYYQLLCREYYFLSKKYGLKCIPSGVWKYARTRPQNFPHRRIAVLAYSTFGGFSIFSRLHDAKNDIDKLIDIFDLKTEGYWKDHFSFDGNVSESPTALSRPSKILLVINVAIPLLYAYASSIGDLELAEKTAGLMLDLPSENNGIIKQWESLGFTAKDASRTQALIHLRKEYCDKKKCLYCRFGHLLLRQKVSR